MEKENDAVKGTIRQRVQAVRAKISESAGRAGRSAGEIRLVGVTKTRTVEEMQEAVPLVDALGENRVQEALSKKESWPSEVKAEWRLIGHLQSNKVRRAVTLFDSLDSLDSVSLVRAVERAASEEGRLVPVLIEVNTAEEDSKTGALPEDFPEILDCILESSHLNLQGLMTIGPLTEEETRVRRAFARLREMASEARRRSGLPLPVLSMGMSSDFQWAILEGSTMVRIGALLFGPRAVRNVNVN
ncbi:MAG: YggS family pyridoxal phosphate-dependent enzyme [Synergistaceae bacterium]|jgi:pyridoxal phosphate enzyme (YggS family)|nr:YggS family pyridoxal phosphate-dependent enzyme [Synergistaceae bacterium]